MNQTISARFKFYHRLLIESPIISRYAVVKQRVVSNDGYIRIRATLEGGGLLEFSEYIVFNDDLLIEREYSFHWQDAHQRLIQRWDNAKHFPKLPYAPHHVHLANGTVEGSLIVPTLAFVLDDIRQYIWKRK